MAFTRPVLLLFTVMLFVSSSFAHKTAVLRTSTQLESFLEIIQAVALQDHVNSTADFDPKFYVDIPLKQSLNATSAAYVDFQHSNKNLSAEFPQFVDEHFDVPGSDLEQYNLTDFQKEPQGFLPGVTSTEARNFALKIHDLWFLLARKVKDSVHEYPDQHTLLPLPHPVVVPGSRFREVYYWDTYWIVRGLLVGKLYDTAKSVLNNLVFLIDTYGFMPNGARSYYLNRSQPPLLSAAIREVYEATKDLAFVEKAYPALLKEHKFWTTDPHLVKIRDHRGVEHRLSRYYAFWDGPRTESYTTDVQKAQGLDDKEKPAFYHNAATTAETGWDFSSRWMADRYNLTTLKTTYILPVDLNAFLVQMEHNLAYFSHLMGKHGSEKHFNHLAKARRRAMDAIMWNEEMRQYNDYWLANRNDNEAFSKMNFKELGIVYHFKKENQNTDIFPSNFFPLWGNVLKPDEKKVGKLVAAFNSSGLLNKAGVSTSLLETGQQWDFPNGWAPLQHMMVEGLANSNTPLGNALAKEISTRWLETSYVGFLNTGVMLEKYDVRDCGITGKGGEYNPQAGFGWTNGVVLSFFERYGWDVGTSLQCPTQ